MRWLGFIVVVGYALWPHTGRCQTFSDVSLVLGMQALEQGDDAQAMGYLVPAANNSPNDTIGITARFMAAQAAANLGLWEQASLYLQKLEIAMPEVSDVIFARQAQAWRGLGAWDRAQVAWRHVLEVTHAADLRANAAFGIADADYAMGRWDQAIVGYHAAIALPKQKARSLIAKLNMALMEEARQNVSVAANLYRDVAYKGHDEICADVAQNRLENLQRVANVPKVAWMLQLDRLDYWIRNRNFDRATRDLEAMRRAFVDAGQQQNLASRQSPASSQTARTQKRHRPAAQTRPSRLRTAEIHLPARPGSGPRLRWSVARKRRPVSHHCRSQPAFFRWPRGFVPCRLFIARRRRLQTGR